MIIVKTNNGDRFINEAETLQVSHIKDKALVEVWPSRWGNHERIRKSIIELLNEVHFTFKHYDINKMLAWLEKQETENIILENRIVQLQEKLRDFGCEL